MRTTIILDDELIDRARKLTGIKEKTALVHQSLVILPETPMTGRLFDPRVGYFTEQFTDYSSPKQWAVDREYIARFRLESISVET